jgi:hypothetical protein
MVTDESELKSVMEYSRMMNSFLESAVKENIRNNNKSLLLSELLNEYKENTDKINHMSESYSLTKEKVFNIMIKYSNNLQYPFDHIYYYVVSVYQLFDKNEEKATILHKIETVFYKLF